MRCFIAVDVDEALKNRILEIQRSIEKLNVNVKMVKPENLHFTLKFIGEVENEVVDLIKNHLSSCLEKMNNFEIEIGGLGYFGSKNYIRVIWLDIIKGKNEMKNLMNIINTHVKFGEKTSEPHLTLGRVKSGKNVHSLLNFIEKNKDVHIGKMSVNELKLKMSVLSKEGPKYSDLAIFKLHEIHEKI